MSIELRDASPNYWSLSGLATTWSSRQNEQTYFVHDPEKGVFLERFERGAFPDAISGREPVRLLKNHDPRSPVYAATTDRTMKLSDAEPGLILAAALSKRDAEAKTIVRDIRGGLYKGLSVGFVCRGDSWGTAADGRTALRTVHRASLSEVSIVHLPSNKNATFEVRHETRGEPIEYRSVPLSWRDDAGPTLTIDEPDADDGPCVHCAGKGREWDGSVCAVCGGSGRAPANDDDDVSGESRRRYTEKERKAMAREGIALPDGSFPIRDQVDLANAISAVARATNYAAAKAHIIRRARALGLLKMLPVSWGNATRRGLAENDTQELLDDLDFAAFRRSR